MIGNKIADKITSFSKKKFVKVSQNNETEEDVEIATPKKRYISPKERKQIIKELRLVPKNDRLAWLTLKKRPISQIKIRNY